MTLSGTNLGGRQTTVWLDGVQLPIIFAGHFAVEVDLLECEVRQSDL